MAEDLSERIRAVLDSVLGITREEASARTQGELPQWDSLAHLNLVIALQEEFGVTFTESQMLAMTTMPAIESILRSKGIAD